MDDNRINFEDALKLMREGKKITHRLLGEDVYLQACYIKLLDEEISYEKIMSIAKMKGKHLHPDMKPKYVFPEDHCSIDPKIHQYPNINLLLIMTDDWEIVE